MDSFTYEITDDSPGGGETYSQLAQGLVDDQRSVTNRVQILLNPVNDAPVFETVNNTLEVAEDSGIHRNTGFAFNIFAGPMGTATDENALFGGQTLSFNVTPLSYAIADESDFFVTPPSLSPSGVLTYEAAEDAFGQFEFEIVLVDSGASDNNRGDINASAPLLLTINVQPVNDAPELIDPQSPLSITIAEDDTMLLPASGGSTPGDLLGSYNAGADNEDDDIAPVPGGNQTISLAPNFPATTSQGGTLDPVLDVNDQVIGFNYTPPTDFVGSDSLIYDIVDNGQSVGLGTNGTPFVDPQTTTVTIPITVTPVNDAPLFTGGEDILVDEDAGPITQIDWMVGLAVSPPTANDEINGTTNVAPQTLSLDLVVLSGGSLFAANGQPTATLTGDSATIDFEALPDVNGDAVVEARLMDSGPDDAGNGDVALVLHTFTISVAAVNDPPTFTPGGPITVAEDSGMYSDVSPWATNISPGPAEEATDQTISRFDVAIPTGQESLFAVAPAISSDGFLTFTPADDAAGSVDLVVNAVDSQSGRSADTTLSITIIDSDDPPVPMDDAVSTSEDNPLTIQASELLANDVDPDLASNPNEQLTVVLDAQFVTSLGALATFNSVTGEILYDPTTSEILKAMGPNETRVDSFTYAVTDANGENPEPTAEVSITVSGLNDAPDLNDDTFSIQPDQTVVLTPLDNDSDADGTIDPASIIITTQPTNGALEIGADGTVEYTPNQGYQGTDSFQYTVADELGQQSQQATVSLRIGLAPNAVDDLAGTSLNRVADFDVLANDVGQTDPATLTITTPPDNGDVVILADGKDSLHA